jgi:hypothetical protein
MYILKTQFTEFMTENLHITIKQHNKVNRIDIKELRNAGKLAG